MANPTGLAVPRIMRPLSSMYARRSKCALCGAPHQPGESWFYDCDKPGAYDHNYCPLCTDVCEAMGARVDRD